MVDHKYLGTSYSFPSLFLLTRATGLGQEILSPLPSTVPAWAEWNAVMKSASPSSPPALTICQLNHTGRQSVRCFWRAPWVGTVAPSSLNFEPHEGLFGKIAFSLVFSKPRELSVQEIAELVELYRQRAACVYKAGWDGVQVHCAHGCECINFPARRINAHPVLDLLSEFLSPRVSSLTSSFRPLSNFRPDEPSHRPVRWFTREPPSNRIRDHRCHPLLCSLLFRRWCKAQLHRLCPRRTIRRGRAHPREALSSPRRDRFHRDQRRGIRTARFVLVCTLRLPCSVYS